MILLVEDTTQPNMHELTEKEAHIKEMLQVVRQDRKFTEMQLRLYAVFCGFLGPEAGPGLKKNGQTWAAQQTKACMQTPSTMGLWVKRSQVI